MPDFDDVEWLAKTEAVRVRIATLKPSQGTPWHFHSAVSDDVFCLDAGLAVELRDPDESHTLRSGERVRIAPRRVHRVANRSAEPMRYLLVQATGPYDFNAVP